MAANALDPAAMIVRFYSHVHGCTVLHPVARTATSRRFFRRHATAADDVSFPLHPDGGALRLLQPPHPVRPAADP